MWQEVSLVSTGLHELWGGGWLSGAKHPVVKLDLQGCICQLAFLTVWVTTAKFLVCEAGTLTTPVGLSEEMRQVLIKVPST